MSQPNKQTEAQSLHAAAGPWTKPRISKLARRLHKYRTTGAKQTIRPPTTGRQIRATVAQLMTSILLSLTGTRQLTKRQTWLRKHRVSKPADFTTVANRFECIPDECIGFSKPDKDSKRTSRQIADKLIARYAYDNARSRLRQKQMRKRQNRRMRTWADTPEEPYHPSASMSIHRSPLRAFLPPKSKGSLPLRMSFAKMAFFKEQVLAILEQQSALTTPDSEPQSMFFPATLERSINARMDGMAEHVTAATTDFSKMCATANSILSTLETLIKNYLLVNQLDKILQWFALLIDFAVAWITDDWKNFPTMVMRLLTYLSIPSLSLSVMMTWLQEYLPVNSISGERNQNTDIEIGTDAAANTNIDAVPQVADTGSWPLLIVSLCGAALLGSLPTKSQSTTISNMIKGFPIANTLSKSIPDIISSIMSLLPDTVQAWYRNNAPISWTMSHLTADDPFFKWIDAVEDISVATYTDAHGRESLTRDAATRDHTLQKKIIELYETGRTLRLRSALEPFFNTKMTGNATHAWTKILELHNRVLIARHSKDTRPTPYVICFTGKPGVGKSMMAPLVARALFDGNPEDRDRCVYTRNEASTFWDRYSGQFCTLFDDHGQFRSSSANSDPYQEFILMASSAPYILNMASLTDKGTTFSSRLVILNTNNSFPGDTTLTERNAFLRRRNMVVEVSIKPSLAHRVLNDPNNPSSGVNALEVDYQDPYGHLVFTLLDKMTNQPVSDTYPMDFRTLVLLIKDRFIQHEAAEAIAGRNAAKAFDDLFAPPRTPDHEPQVLDLIFSRFKRQPPATVPKETFFDCVAHNSFNYWSHVRRQQERCCSWIGTHLTETLCIVKIVSSVAPMFKWIFDAARSHKKPKVTKATQEDAVFQAGRSFFCAECHHQTDYLRAFGMCCSNCRTFNDFAPPNFTKAFVPGEVFPCLGCQNNLNNQMPDMCMMCEKCENIHFFSRQARPQIASGDQRTSKHHNRVLLRTRRQAVPQMGSDQNSNDILLYAIMPNLVRIASNEGAMSALVVKGRIALLPLHFFYSRDGGYIPTGTNLTLTTVHGTILDMAFDPAHITRIDPSKDACLYYLGSKIQPFSDITKHFIMDEDVEHLHQTPAQLLLQRQIGGSLIPTQIPVQAEAMDYAPYNTHCSYARGERFTIVHGWTYKTTLTIKGDCGGALIAINKNIPRKLLGFHVALGQGVQGTSEMITQNMLRPLLNDFVPQVLDLPVPHYAIASMDDALMSPDGNFTMCGVVPKKMVARGPTKSDIIPSAIHDRIFKHTTEPSVLHPRDPRMLVPISPLKQAVEKYAKNGRCLDESLLADITNYVFEEFRGVETYTPRRVLTDAEAINGIANQEYIDPIDFSTAPGYPYILEKPQGAKGKKHLFSFDENNFATITDKSLRDRCTLREAFAKQGHRIDSVWLTTLKDERRALGKIALGKTRVFTIGPVDYTLVFRKYILPFMAHMYRARIRTCSAIGINCESAEWTAVHRRLYRNGYNRGFSADYGNFDGSIPGQIFMRIVELINRWFDGTAEENLVREVLFSEVLHTCQLSINTLYYKHVGGPSGYPGTAPINTLVAKFECCYVWMKNLPPNLTLHDYHNHVNDIIYGDDVKCGVSEEACPYFNITNFNNTMAPHGRTLTMADKLAKITENGPLDSLSFLKRKTRTVGQYAYPLMEPDTICELTNWIRTCDDPHAALIDNCNNALSFAFFYGKEALDTIRGPVERELHAQGISTLGLLTFNSLLARYMNNGMCFPDIYNDNHVLNVKKVLPELPDFDSKEFSRTMDNPFLDRLYYPDAEYQSQDAPATETTGNATLGITFDAQRPTDTESAGHSHPVVSAIKHPTAQDHAWTVGDTSHRPSFTKSGTWTVASAVSTVLERLEVPLDFVTSLIGRTGWNAYALWRGGLKIRIEINGTRMHVGKLIAYYVPLIENSVIAVWHEPNFSASTSIQHCFLDAATNNSGEIVVSYVQTTNYISTERSGPGPVARNYLGNFRLQVFNPLLAGAGSPQSLAYVITAEFIDSQFHIPKPMPLTIQEEQRRLKEAKDTVVRLTRSLMKDNAVPQMFDAEPQMMSIIKKMLPKNTKGDQIDVAGIVDAASAIAGLAMDKPTDSSTKPPFYRQPMQYLNHSTGVDCANLLTLDPSAMTTAEFEHFGTTQDEMDLAYLLRTPTFEFSLVWNMTNVPGFVLFQKFIGPHSFLASRQMNTVALSFPQTANRYRLNCSDYFTTPFTFWRGSRKIKITISASQFATGRLFLGWQYLNFRSLGTTLSDYTGQYGVYIDLENETREWLFEIPFITAYNGWLRVCHGACVDVTQQPSAVNPSVLSKFFTGTWYLVVVNNLVVPDTVPGSVYINIFESGGSDYEVNVPSDVNSTLVPILAGDLAHDVDCDINMKPPNEPLDQSFEITDAIPQSADNDDAATTVISMQQDAKPGRTLLPAPVPFIDNQLGERVGSVKDVIKRHAFVYGLRLQADQSKATFYSAVLYTHSTVDVIPVAPPMHHVINSPYLQYRGLFGFYALSYAAWRGNINYTVMFQQDRTMSMRNFVGFQPIDDTMRTRINFGGGFEQPDSNPVNWQCFADAYGCNPDPFFQGESGSSAAALKLRIDQGGYTARGSYQAIDYADDGGNYCRVSCPYQTTNRIMVNDFRAFKASYFDQNVMGSLIIGTTYRTAQTNAIQPGISGFTDAQIFSAAGDNFRFGVFLGPHMMSFRTFPVSVDPAVTGRYPGYWDNSAVVSAQGIDAVPQMADLHPPDIQYGITLAVRTLQSIRHEWTGEFLTSAEERAFLEKEGIDVALPDLLDSYINCNENGQIILDAIKLLDPNNPRNAAKSPLQILNEFTQYADSGDRKGKGLFRVYQTTVCDTTPFGYQMKLNLMHISASGRGVSSKKKDALAQAASEACIALIHRCEAYRQASIDVSECATLQDVFAKISVTVNDADVLKAKLAGQVLGGSPDKRTKRLTISPNANVILLRQHVDAFVSDCNQFLQLEPTADTVKLEIDLVNEAEEMEKVLKLHIGRLTNLVKIVRTASDAVGELPTQQETPKWEIQTRTTIKNDPRAQLVAEGNERMRRIKLEAARDRFVKVHYKNKAMTHLILPHEEHPNNENLGKFVVVSYLAGDKNPHYHPMTDSESEGLLETLEDFDDHEHDLCDADDDNSKCTPDCSGWREL